jgi:hypothetical protein
MKSTRVLVLSALLLLAGVDAHAQTDPLPSWNDGPAKQPILDFGNFPDALMAQAKKQGWVVISMMNDWKRIFAFE